MTLSPQHQAILRDLNTSLAALDEGESVMVLVNGKDDDKNPFYAFVNLPASRLVGFYDAIRAGEDIKLADYGEVVQSGEGLEPPAEIRREMAENYNLDYSLGEKLRFLFAF